MVSFRVQVFILALILQGVIVESGTKGRFYRKHRVRWPELGNLYKSRVYYADLMKEPLEGLPWIMGHVSHAGVRVTLMNGERWLIHKGLNFGVESHTVVMDARLMFSSWEFWRRKYFNGRKTIGDFVRAGGRHYNLFTANCHHAAHAMMSL